MAYAHASRARRRRAHNPLAAPVAVFVAAIAIAVSYVAYVLWPRWPEVPVNLDSPALPIIVAGTSFTIEPAAIRMRVQRHPGTHERIDLAYVWPTLTPPDPAEKPSEAPAPVERLFVTIQGADGTLAPMQRVETIYPRYLAPEPEAGPDGLTLRAFREDTPYKDEELVFDSASPAHFLARCSKRGAVGPGNCLLDRRIGEADITIRFSRDWLSEWRKVADAVNALVQRLHPDSSSPGLSR
jgi:hypothetical protein